MNKSVVPVSDEIWGLLRETDRHLKELAVSQKETEKNIKETEKNIKETEKNRKEDYQEIRQILKDLAVSRKETDRQIQKMGGGFNQRWGRFVESLVSGNLVKIFQERGIDIMRTHTRSQTQWKNPAGGIQRREFDIIVANGTEVVVVEVKTALYSRDVHTFLDTLKDFRKYFPRYKTETIYGAVAYLTSEDKAHFLAENKGLFIIRATGDSANIVNQKDFKPKAF